MTEKNIRKSISRKYHRFFKRGISGMTASSRVLPNFIIIGTVRSGSTSLYYNICEHPSVLQAAYDEIGFFDSNFHLGIDWYRSMFPTKNKMNDVLKDQICSITGEDTPFYFWKKEAAERIYQILPNIKLILICRNPIDRAYSNYNLAIRNGSEKFSFENAIEDEIKFMDNHTFRECADRPRSYLTKGLYAEQLKIWYEIFSKEKILIISTEELQKRPVDTLSNVYEFLKIPQYSIKNIQKQKSAKYDKMNQATRKKLQSYFEPHNRVFFNMIQKEFDWDK